MSTSILNCMEAHYMGELPKDVQKLIISQLISGKDLDAIINGLKNASRTTLKTTLDPIFNNPIEFRNLIQTLEKQFSDIPSETIAKKFANPISDYSPVDIKLLAGVNDFISLLPKIFPNTTGETIVKQFTTVPAALTYIILGNSLIEVTEEKGDRKMLQQLLDMGADINYQKIHGLRLRHAKASPLLIAIKKTNAPLVKWLLEKGANPNIKDLSTEEHSHALMYAVDKLTWYKMEENELIFIKTTKEFEEARYLTIIQLLLEYGADPHAKDKNGLSLLSWNPEWIVKNPQIQKLLEEKEKK